MSTVWRRPRRLVNKADFKCLLAARALSRSAHFAVHYVAGAPSRHPRRVLESCQGELSTYIEPIVTEPVDDFLAAHWLGCMVPKRHARRAVTRSLLKRQVREVFKRHASWLPFGIWLVRLRAPFATERFVSASSLPLARVIRAELDELFGQLEG
jgi:ribonuclease P protein component